MSILATSDSAGSSAKLSSPGLSYSLPGSKQGVERLSSASIYSIAMKFGACLRLTTLLLGTTSETLQQGHRPLMKLALLGVIEELCPFQVTYEDGVERLAAGSPRKRIRWVGAIWYVFSRRALHLVY
jgi:hypothetical protein